jgi:dienelactone hydrolase
MAPGPRLVASPASSLVDAPLRVSVAGCRPDQAVTIRAQVDDPRRGRWRSEAVYRADGAGAVDLASACPVGGAYRGADPLGLLWTLAPDPAVPGTVGFAGPSEPFDVELSVEAEGAAGDGPDRQGGAEARRARVRRCFMGPDVARQPVRDAGLVGTLFMAADGAPRPGVLVVGGSDGGLSEGLAALLASHGFAALALAYFRAEQLPADLVEIPLEYFERAIQWLGARPEVAAGGLGVVGRSRGGELALLLGATFPEVAAVVGYVPSGVVHAGIGTSASGSGPRSAWTWRGRPLPFVPPVDAGAPSPPGPAPGGQAGAPLELTPMFLSALENRAAVDAAAIPVERIRGPVLLLSGEDDRLWPSPVLADMAAARLAAHGHPHAVTHLRYPAAGHAFGAVGLPATANTIVHPLRGRAMALGGTPAANAAAAADSWPRVLRLLRTALTGG